ncbi:hypothetical protein [Paracoccus benzoatiresistens]|uniref:Uncharacterized protein n=1 Tax=Paracoccus benzoatiresistens TaxID=2997341 RepID=A0ABT4J6V2_9RHOB|nr:hypothetical protein [Paracoccus sp. EF6]MCZ0962853.1 hypothetical protein [Paracoccus sp. EF6]
MSEREEWGPWVEHDGKGCPCIGMYVRMESKGCSCRHLAEGIAREEPEWGKGLDAQCKRCGVETVVAIGRYQIRKPRGLTILQDLIENPPAPRVSANREMGLEDA